MVCPPETTASVPRSLKTAARPSPAHTARKPYFFSGGATAGAAFDTPDSCSSSSSTASKSSVLWAFRPAAKSSA